MTSEVAIRLLTKPFSYKISVKFLKSFPSLSTPMYLFIVFEPVLNAVAEAAESVIKVLTE